MCAVDDNGVLFNHTRLSTEQVRFYDEQGYLIIEGVVTARGLDLLRQECMQAWQAEKCAFDAQATWLQNALLGDIHRLAPTVGQYYYTGPLVDVVEQLIGPNIKGAGSQLTFKMRGNTMPFGWHQDNGYGELDPYNTVSTLTALDDADVHNGGLWLIPRSQKQGQIRVGMTPERKAAGVEIAVDVDETRALPMTLHAGDVLLFHCWMLHKSNGNMTSDRDRRVLFLRYADADAIEVYNDGKPRLGKVLRGTSRFAEVREYESSVTI